METNQIMGAVLFFSIIGGMVMILFWGISADAKTEKEFKEKKRLEAEDFGIGKVVSMGGAKILGGGSFTSWHIPMVTLENSFGERVDAYIDGFGVELNEHYAVKAEKRSMGHRSEWCYVLSRRVHENDVRRV
jgi:hypothetical protein